MLDRAHDDVLKINDEYEKTKQEFAKFRTTFRSFMSCQIDMFEGLEKDYFKNYNVSNVSSISNEIRDRKGQQEISGDAEFSNLTLKNIDEKNLKCNDLEEIKTFFAKE